jgi:hypothetical protein
MSECQVEGCELQNEDSDGHRECNSHEGPSGSCASPGDSGPTLDGSLATVGAGAAGRESKIRHIKRKNKKDPRAPRRPLSTYDLYFTLFLHKSLR